MQIYFRDSPPGGTFRHKCVQAMEAGYSWPCRWSPDTNVYIYTILFGSVIYLLYLCCKISVYNYIEQYTVPDNHMGHGVYPFAHMSDFSSTVGH